MSITFVQPSGQPAFALVGNEKRTIRSLVSIAAADADGDVKIFAEVSAMAVLIDAIITNTAITAGTAFKLGLYKRVSKPADSASTVDTYQFEEIDDDAISGASAIDLSSARAEGAGVSAIGGITVANRLKKVYELAGHTVSTKQQSYFLGLKGATIGSAAGSVGIDVSYINAVQ